MSQSTPRRTRTQAWAQLSNPEPATRAETPAAVGALAWPVCLACDGRLHRGYADRSRGASRSRSRPWPCSGGRLGAAHSIATHGARWLLLSAFPVAIALRVAAATRRDSRPRRTRRSRSRCRSAASCSTQRSRSVHVGNTARPCVCEHVAIEGQAASGSSTQAAWPRRSCSGSWSWAPPAVAVVAPLWPSSRRCAVPGGRRGRRRRRAQRP